MHIVVNSFALEEGVDWTELASQVDEFQKRLAGEQPDFRGVALVRVSDAQAIFLVLFDNRQALDDISRNIAGPWFAEHVPAPVGARKPPGRRNGRRTHEVAGKGSTMMADFGIGVFGDGAPEPKRRSRFPATSRQLERIIPALQSTVPAKFGGNAT